MSTRTPILIGWLVVFGASFALFLVVAVLAWWQHRRSLAEPRPSAERQALTGSRSATRPVGPAERAEWVAHAAAVAAREQEATARVAEARARAAAAEQARGEAWQALADAQREYDAAEAAYQRASQQRATRPADPARAREVASAALAAYRRGDISQDELLRVWRWGSGWDPELDRRERALRQRRAARREANLRYLAAATAERAAADRLDLAEAEARVLAEEWEYASRYVDDPG